MLPLSACLGFHGMQGLSCPLSVGRSRCLQRHTLLPTLAAASLHHAPPRSVVLILVYK